MNLSFDIENKELFAPIYQKEKSKIEVIKKHYSNNTLKFSNKSNKYFYIQNRRYLGNKFKLLGFIEEIIRENCSTISSFCDIFSGTGVVGNFFNNENIKIISNDFMHSNYMCLNTFLKANENQVNHVTDKIKYLNNLNSKDDNYFSINFGGNYFSEANAKKIGVIREQIELISDNIMEKYILICSLLYSVDKVANTVGHYDAFRKKFDSFQNVKLLIPKANFKANKLNEVHNNDANELVRNIKCDVLYIDPPYNSRQYSGAYHLLENLATWNKPEVKGIAKKMNRNHLKSAYCLSNATNVFSDLIQNANCKHILLSYNNTGKSKNERSNARIKDKDIIKILKQKGEVKIYQCEYKSFTTGKSTSIGNIERIFYCKVKEKL